MSHDHSAYSAFTTLLTTYAIEISPAELQGFLLGRCCAGAGFSAAPWLADSTILFDTPPPEALHTALMGLQEMARREFTGDAFSVVLLLPSDEASLAQRTEALGAWCQGFLNGFGLALGARTLSAQAQEVLEDLVAIAQIQKVEEASEAAEHDYMELVEYLSVMPILLFAECAAITAHSAQTTLH